MSAEWKKPVLTVEQEVEAAMRFMRTADNMPVFTTGAEVKAWIAEELQKAQEAVLRESDGK